jgi:predicted ATP-dependent endonuclease of OLD family
MDRLIIDNIGPISHIDIPINRVNVIIGKQSSGKSTIAKVLSFCLWLEKDIVAHQDKDYIDSALLKKELLNYHKIANYFNEGAYIHYEGNYITFEYHDLEHFNITMKESFKNAKNGKVAYIPSERNLVVLNNISSLPMDKSYVRDFLFNWLTAHSKYSKKEAMPIVDLNVRYYYDEESKSDRIILPNEKELEIDEASSGIQSVIPLYIYMNYVTKWIFENEEGTSYDKYSVIRKALLKEIAHDADDAEIDSYLGSPSLQMKIQENLALIRKTTKEYLNNLDLATVSDLMERLEKPHYANMIIEEPELNLFPQTQVRLIYAMLKEIDFGRDMVLMTTHSPYTLYAVNNCMLSYKVAKDLDEEDKASLLSYSSRINPDMVSVWQTNDDGTLSDIKTSPFGLIGKHYFNEVMNDTLDEYHTMIDYLEL